MKSNNSGNIIPLLRERGMQLHLLTLGEREISNIDKMRSPSKKMKDTIMRDVPGSNVFFSLYDYPTNSCCVILQAETQAVIKREKIPPIVHRLLKR